MDFEKACYDGNVAAAKRFLDNGSPISFECLADAVSTQIKSEAAKKIPLCKLLYAAGADPNMKRPEGHASILEVAAVSYSPEILRLTIAAGANVIKGCPLHAAVSGDRPENIQILLDAGADPSVGLTNDHLDEQEVIFGMTALEYAKHIRHKKCVSILSNVKPKTNRKKS